MFIVDNVPTKRISHIVHILGGLEQMELLLRNSEIIPKSAIEEASTLILANRDKTACDAGADREHLVGFIGPYSSGCSKAVSNFLQIPSVDVAMISPSSTVGIPNPHRHFPLASQMPQKIPCRLLLL